MSQNFIHFLIIALLLLNTILLLNCSHIMGGSSEGFAPKKKGGKPKKQTPQNRCNSLARYAMAGGSGGWGMFKNEGCEKFNINFKALIGTTDDDE